MYRIISAAYDGWFFLLRSNVSRQIFSASNNIVHGAISFFFFFQGLLPRKLGIAPGYQYIAPLGLGFTID
jgi:hypothetical protein